MLCKPMSQLLATRVLQPDAEQSYAPVMIDMCTPAWCRTYAIALLLSMERSNLRAPY